MIKTADLLARHDPEQCVVCLLQKRVALAHDRIAQLEERLAEARTRQFKLAEVLARLKLKDRLYQVTIRTQRNRIQAMQKGVSKKVIGALGKFFHLRALKPVSRSPLPDPDWNAPSGDEVKVKEGEV